MHTHIHTHTHAHTHKHQHTDTPHNTTRRGVKAMGECARGRERKGVPLSAAWGGVSKVRMGAHTHTLTLTLTLTRTSTSTSTLTHHTTRPGGV